MALSFQRSIRTKLILLITSMASLSVLIACTTLLVYEFMQYRKTLLEEESTMAQLVETSSGPALLFGDRSAANETLSVLRTDPRISQACLYDRGGKPVAEFHASAQTTQCPAADLHPSLRFTFSDLLIHRLIHVDSEVTGSLYLRVSLQEMFARILHFAEVGGCVLLLTSAFALLLATFLERLISKPILHLTRIATEVSRKQDYTLRAQRFSDDEAGVLIDQFNAMMERVEQREKELQDAQDSLEDKVRLRTQDLSNEIAERKLIEKDLETARLAAEESNRAKSTFLSSMSHELRTPLNAIIGYSEMMQEDAQAAGDKDRESDLANVLVSARHLLSLIGEILDLSKIEAGQMKLFPEQVRVAEILSEIVPTAEVLARKNNNRVILTDNFWDGQMFVDSLRFRQCLLNLISNACKFTERGMVWIDVSLVHQQGASWVHWSIKDSGIGIPAESQQKLFKSFSQVDGSTTRKYGGTGLGLAISQQLCLAMGGSIEFESQPGSGSTFTIIVPAAQPGSGEPWVNAGVLAATAP